MVQEQVRHTKLFGTVRQGRRQAYLVEIGAKDHLPTWQRRQRVSVGSRSGPPQRLSHRNILLHFLYLLPHHVPLRPIPRSLHISDISSPLRRLRVEPLFVAALLA